jgi:hypothetical protein
MKSQSMRHSSSIFHIYASDFVFSGSTQQQPYDETGLYGRDTDL